MFALLAVLCTLAPSPDALDKAGAVLKLLVACGVLVVSGLGVYALGTRYLRDPVDAAGSHHLL